MDGIGIWVQRNRTFVRPVFAYVRLVPVWRADIKRLHAAIELASGKAEDGGGKPRITTGLAKSVHDMRALQVAETLLNAIAPLHTLGA